MSLRGGERHHGAAYRCASMIRTSEETFGVPACHVRGSRKTAAPSGSGQGVLSFIQSGSSSRAGIGAVQWCEPVHAMRWQSRTDPNEHML